MDYGIEATWNDNNEFEIWDDAARVDLNGEGGAMACLRPVQSLAMMRASRLAQTAHAPMKRPFLISRSGGPGMQRYVQTWTGDNRTSWETLRYNLRMGHGLSLSGIFNFGHDVGGFAGPTPEHELLLRWIEQGIYWPRLTIHSWNDDGSATEPWMYPEILPSVRAALNWRERLIPLLYTLMWRAHVITNPFCGLCSSIFLSKPKAMRKTIALWLVLICSSRRLLSKALLRAKFGCRRPQAAGMTLEPENCFPVTRVTQLKPRLALRPLSREPLPFYLLVLHRHGAMGRLR